MYDFRRSNKLHRVEDGAQARLPDFVCIGAPKCGTTWLFDNLHEHPEVFVPDFKETNYFSVSRWGAEYESQPLSYYLSFFKNAPASTVVGDISTNVLHDPYCGERLQALVPDAKIVVMLRDPVSRAQSHYFHTKHRAGSVGASMLELLEDPRRDGAGILSQGLYGEQIERLFEYVDEDRVIVVLFDDIIDNPERVYEWLCEELDIDSSFVPIPLGESRTRRTLARSIGVPHSRSNRARDESVWTRFSAPVDQIDRHCRRHQQVERSRSGQSFAERDRGSKIERLLPPRHRKTWSLA
ncbi:MAG: sulfotransferase [Polyangiales bacterium]